MNHVVSYTDALDPIQQSDFDPRANVSLLTYPTLDESKAYDFGLKDYLQVPDPERFVCACVRKMTIDNDYLDYFPNLKMIQIISSGFEKIDLDELRRRGITLCSVKGLYSGHMAEDIIMRMTYLTRKTWLAAQQQRDHVWHLIKPIGALMDSTAVFIGTGTIATETSKRLQSFGVRVLGVDRTGADRPWFEKVYPFSQVQEAVAQADFIICCLPQDPSTNNIINKDVFDYVKPGAMFINVGRGTAVDEEALYEALQSGRLASASSDVFQTEPLRADSPFWNMPNFLITPHHSGGFYWGAGAQRRKFVAQNISRFLMGEEVENRVI